MGRLWIALLVLLGFSLAQYQGRLLLGAQETQARYPGGGSVAYGPARLVAEALGLGYLEAGGRVYLSLGSRVAAFGVSTQSRDALRFENAYRYQGEPWVPVRALARNLDLFYRVDYGAPVLALRPSRLLSVKPVGEKESRYLLEFDRDVQVRPLGGSPARLALIGVTEVPQLEADSKLKLDLTDWGAQLTLPPGDPPRLLFLPSQVVVERAAGARLPRVVLDPGHGGADVGVGVDGLKEKDLNLSVAQRLAKLLQERGVEVVLTRRADQAVPLLARAQFASTAQVFISLHAAGGSRVHVYSHPETQTLRLIEKGRELFSKTPSDQRQVLERFVAAPGGPARFAQGITEAFAGAGLTASASQDPMFVLTQAGGAAVLVEVGIEQLRTPQGREQVAGVLAQAIFSHLGLPEPKVQAPQPAQPAAQPAQPGANRP